MLQRTPEITTGACRTPARSTHDTRRGGSNSTLCWKSVLLRPLGAGALAVGLSGKGGSGTTEVRRRETGARVPVCPRGFQRPEALGDHTGPGVQDAPEVRLGQLLPVV